MQQKSEKIFHLCILQRLRNMFEQLIQLALVGTSICVGVKETRSTKWYPTCPMCWSHDHITRVPSL